MRYNKTTTSKLSKYPVSTLIYIPSTAEPQKSFSFSTCTMLRWKGGYFVALAPNRPSVLLASRCIVDFPTELSVSARNHPRHEWSSASPSRARPSANLPLAHQSGVGPNDWLNQECSWSSQLCSTQDRRQLFSPIACE